MPYSKILRNLKVRIDVIRKWVERRIAELTGDDQVDVVPGFVISQLEQEDIS